jgi:hypothetical protein
MKSFGVPATFGICSIFLGMLVGDAIHSASGAPVIPDWGAVVTETRQRLGPVRPMQTCVDYSRATIEVCRKRELDCFELSFSCSITGHSVVIGRYASGGKRWCGILDATNRSNPSGERFACEDLDRGMIRPDPVYCNGVSDCSCEILGRDAVYKNSDPASAAAIYRPTFLRTIFGARSRCRTSCEEQRHSHEQEEKVIQQGCDSNVALPRNGDAWGIESWLQTMSQAEICSYLTQYADETRRFYAKCVDSCESFRDGA